MTTRRRRQSIDTPGFWGYIGGGRQRRDQQQPLHGNPCRAMFEFMPADEDCPPACYKCKPRRRQRPQGGGS